MPLKCLCVTQQTNETQFAIPFSFLSNCRKAKNKGNFNLLSISNIGRIKSFFFNINTFIFLMYSLSIFELCFPDYLNTYIINTYTLHVSMTTAECHRRCLLNKLYSMLRYRSNKQSEVDCLFPLSIFL